MKKQPVVPPVYRPQPPPTVQTVQPSVAKPNRLPPIQPRAILPSPSAAAHRATVRPDPPRPVRFAAPVVNGHTASTGSVIQQARKPPKKPPQKKAVVTLTVDDKNYSGVSSGQYGHAEMLALRKFIVAQDSIEDAWDTLETADKKKVLCPNQPVCGSCTMILEALGFRPKGMTEFSTEKSGGVSWGANMKVQELMTHGGLANVYQSAVRAGAK